MDITNLSIRKAADLVAKRELSPVALSQAFLERIETFNPYLNAFITLMADAALKRAAEAEAEISNSHYRGPLHGIPIALKDIFDVQEFPTTAGSKFFQNHIASVNSTVATRLDEAGAIQLGKLNLHEWALGVTTDNPFYGTCKNPWDLARIPGGSSGGSSAALAAALCLGSMGSDTRGSIRTPASMCGVVGLKPTLGRVSLRGVVPACWNLDHVGPMGRCVTDAALLLQTTAGYDPADPYSVDVPTGDYLTNLEAGVVGWRVAVAQDDFFGAVDSPIQEAMQSVSQVFEDLGAVVSWVDMAYLREAGEASRVMVAVEAAAFHESRLQTRPEGFSADIRTRLEKGKTYTGIDYANALRTQTIMRYRMAQFFQDYALLLTPTTPLTAPLCHDEPAMQKARANMSRFAAPFNLLGLPAISLPCGFTTGGLPIGLQVIGPIWGEAAVLQAGRAYERATCWHKRRPDLEL